MKNSFSRRDFLRKSVVTGAVTGAGLAIAPSIFAAPANEKKDDINLAMIGMGAQGETLWNSYNKMEGLRFRAVCDIWDYKRNKISNLLGKYARRMPRYKANSYVDYQEMLDKEKDLDAVIIATPDFWHAEQTIACLKAGINVYCEKEMSNTIEGARKMVQAQKESGKLLQIGQQRRSNPRYIHCKNELLDKAKILGRITTVNGQWNRAARPDDSAPKGFEMDQARLEKYGFKSMEQFMNWRWYKGLGGGPIVDLGSHQIDIYNWFLNGTPRSVTASGGTDYYDKKTHEWYDTVMAIYEYDTPDGIVRAFYQTQTTNSANGYSETFMGIDGTLNISESSSRGAAYPEDALALETIKTWDKYVSDGILNAPEEEEDAGEDKEEDIQALMDSRETIAPPAYKIPVIMEEKYHQPHVVNFFDAIRGKTKLNCPGEEAFVCAVAVHKVNEAIEAGKRLEFKPEDFKV